MVIVYKKEPTVADATIDIQALVLASLKKNFNFPSFSNDVMQQIVKAELDKLVASSATPFDDIALAALWPPLSAGIQQALTALWASLGTSTPASPGAGLGAAV